MDYVGPNHVYWTFPQTPSNMALPESERVAVGLKCVTVPDLDADMVASSMAMATEPQSKWADIQRERTYALIKSKFVGVRNLTIGGEPVRDFDHFYSDAPPDIVSWVCKAVYRTEVLSEYEIKN